MDRCKEIMAARDIERTLDRLACQILEQIPDHESIALVGIQRRGADLACRLCGLLSARTRLDIPCGELDINLYRDDWTS
ncbi:bifunctional pyr operon transcriptional regulator/uracil phosphoribosyltransferase, partial [Desulfoprunum benzoelyticum]|nr:bifunctional pyr operon transcriptional regulator/uracil phosphoribosyltransferase [Desulfoprunum benzoelyticum]